MVEARFLQVHWLVGYPGTLLNSDDTGLAKRLPFGGVTRMRVSSQAIKRRLRVTHGEMQLTAIPGVETALRSKEIVEREVLRGLAEETGRDSDLVNAVRPEFEKALYGEKGNNRESRQALLIGWPEVRFLRSQAIEILRASTSAEDATARAASFRKRARGALRAMRDNAVLPAGIESALFGRMITSDPSANIEGAIHVAHAITVHEVETEIDFVTVVDDLAKHGEPAVAGIFDAELTSGLYYGYLVVDVPGLVSNLTGRPRAEWSQAETDRVLAGEVVYRLLHLIATVSPGAKKGSTAPYAYADTILVEIGSRQPRTLANAFVEPVPLRPGLSAAARASISHHLEDLDANYGAHELRRVLTKPDDTRAFRGIVRGNLADLASFARDAIVQAEV